MNPDDKDLSYPEEAWTNADDVALVRRMVEMDETALGALYDQWSRALYSLVLHLLQDCDEAEDVVEETFWQAWRKASSYEQSKGTVSTWLLTIGRRTALDQLLARRRNHEEPGGRISFADLPSGDSGPFEDADLAERRESVRAALRGLPHEQREVLELAYFHGLTHSGISDATGQPIGTVKTRMRLAIQKLRDSLAAYRRAGE